MRRGLQAVLQESHGARLWADHFATYALAARDEATARAVVDALGDDFGLTVWGTWNLHHAWSEKLAQVKPAPEVTIPTLAPAIEPVGWERHFAGEDGAEATATVYELFSKRRFAVLTALAQALRTTPPDPTAPFRDLDSVYAAFGWGASTGQFAEAQFSEDLKQLNHWAKAEPQDPTPLVAEAVTWIQYGWLARGPYFANAVSEQGWRLFKDRCGKAEQALETAEDLGCHDQGFYISRLEAGLGLDWPLAKMEENFHAGVQVEPAHSHLLWNYMGQALLSRWLGSPQKLLALGEEAARQPPPSWQGRGEVLAAYLANDLVDVSDDGPSIKGKGAYAPDRFRPALQAEEQRSQGWERYEIENLSACLAWSYHDARWLQASLAHLDHHFNDSVWGDRLESLLKSGDLPPLPLAAEPVAGGSLLLHRPRDRAIRVTTVAGHSDRLEPLDSGLIHGGPIISVDGKPLPQHPGQEQHP
jgi:hypothetical protein